VEERQAQALEPKDPAGAKAARARGIDLLEQAMSVQAGVIDASAPSAPHAPSPTNSAAPPASARPESSKAP
jgi:hypothetical protein